MVFNQKTFLIIYFLYGIGDINDHSSHRSKYTFTNRRSFVPIRWWHATVSMLLLWIQILILDKCIRSENYE